VRGKKDAAFVTEEAYNDVLDKRAPAMGFQGVRGKKEDRRGPSMGFHGMRGKKDGNSEQEYLQEYLDKRAPSLGFMGMRGKKDELDFDYFDKRAPSLGFQGMRGKKDGGYLGANRVQLMGMRGDKDLDLEGDDYTEMFSDENLDAGLEDGDDVEKRAPTAGFFGMRGKKVPTNGFFGMRGKKGPSVGFFAMRGKKAPSAGFFGMRGKKEYDEPMDLDTLLSYLGAAYQQERNKRSGGRSPGSKKAPVGFLGTRGKKEWPVQQGRGTCDPEGSPLLAQPLHLNSSGCSAASLENINFTSCL
jgi:hypothetical protein